MQIASIEKLIDHARTAGEIALDVQRTMRYGERSFKDDGSILTEADPRVEAYLTEQIGRLYPYANIVGEESIWSYDPERPYTFAIDPIDGTDAFSQGMHGWSVSIGLLDRALLPVAGIVYAPRLDMLFFADVGQAATLNGQAIRVPERSLPLDRTTNVMAYSRLHAQVNLTRYPGKVRSIGSAALHICFTACYPGIYASIEGRRVHIWDIAGAHAVIRSHGWTLGYLGGGTVAYGGMMEGQPAGDLVISGRPEHVEALRGLLREEDPSTQTLDGGRG
jgi:myo-inositol-1(or 4)-monophosphatase